MKQYDEQKSAYRAFMGPEHLPSLEGQRYVVLRPKGELHGLYGEIQADLLKSLSDEPVTRPLEPHVMIRGYPSGDLSVLGSVVETWAAATPPLSLKLETVTIFPDPFRVVIFLIEKTRELADAFQRLASLSKEHGLPEWPEGTTPRTVEEWKFHMSIVYASELSDKKWEQLVGQVEALQPARATFSAGTAELVTYDDLEEHSKVYSLRGKAH